MRQGMDCSCACFTAASIPDTYFLTANTLTSIERIGTWAWAMWFSNFFLVFVDLLRLLDHIIVVSAVGMV